MYGAPYSGAPYAYQPVQMPMMPVSPPGYTLPPHPSAAAPPQPRQQDWEPPEEDAAAALEEVLQAHHDVRPDEQRYLLATFDFGKLFKDACNQLPYKIPSRQDFFNLLDNAAQQGYPYAQFCLARCFEAGRCCVADMATAVYWYKQAADQDLALALYKLAGCYQDNRGVPPQPSARRQAAALPLWKAAAQGGVADARLVIATQYIKGTKGLRSADFKLAEEWLKEGDPLTAVDADTEAAEELSEAGVDDLLKIADASYALDEAAKAGDVKALKLAIAKAIPLAATAFGSDLLAEIEAAQACLQELRRAAKKAAQPPAERQAVQETHAEPSIEGVARAASTSDLDLAAAAPAGEPAGPPPMLGVFICPLTQEIMTDPVAATDGHTYQRSAIEAWLATHDTSPVTHEPLKSKALTPNLLLRSMVRSTLS
ncbi:hypothetical protein WJX72_001764 [[Myrmecia] bisecta]|uniref:U-box domain-containing protein n=1 Tax=[Myrmecia] bisecta TaxID=41462 RepID=A0AAW1PFS6_9CHLO